MAIVPAFRRALAETGIATVFTALTLSVGVFGGRLEPGDSWDQLIHAADQALEQARQYGGNRVHTTATLGRMAHAGMMTSSHATFPTSLH